MRSQFLRRGGVRRASLVLSEALEQRTLLSAGDLDPTFGGGDGIVAHPDVGRAIGAVDAVALPDGKTIVLGEQSDRVQHSDFMLARYNADGTLDTTFGRGGRVSTDFAFGNDYPVAVALTPDGRIVALGTHTIIDTGTTEIALARYNPDGSLDKTFDGDGRSLQRITYFGTRAVGLAVRDDGRILVAATANSATTHGYDLAVVRYLPGGALDTSFDGDGFALTNLGSDEEATAMALRPDGHVVVAGHTFGPTSFRSVLVGLNADGSRDAAFGDGGVARVDGVDPFTTDVIAENDNSVVVSSRTPQDGPFDVALARFTAGGVPDPTFGTNGRLVIRLEGDDYPRGLALQPDGKILVGIRPPNGNQFGFTIARVTRDGKLDPSFAGNGVADVLLPQYWDLADLVVQPSGKIVAVGRASYGGGYDIVLARLSASGALDPSFRSTNEPPDPVGLAGGFSDVVIQPDGKILAVGTSTDHPSTTGGYGQPTDWDMYLARFLPDGTPDPTFGTAGKVLADFGSGTEGGWSVALQPDGRIVVLGTVLARFLPDGRLDTSFGGGDGSVEAPDASEGLALQADGKIVISVSYYADRSVRRYNSDGTPDTTFADAGRFSDFAATGISSFRPSDVAIQPTTGKIIVGGDGDTEEEGRSWVVIRLNLDGTVDKSFGGGGAATHNRDSFDLGGRIAIRPSDGLIAMAGDEDDDDADLVLFGPNGEFGSDNRLPYYPEYGHDVAFGPDGDVFHLALEVPEDYSPFRPNIRVTRFDLNNSGDAFYSVRTEVFGNPSPAALTVQPNGDVVVVGSSAGAPFVLRYQGSGAPAPIQLYSDGSLSIHGTDGADTLNLSLAGETLTVQLNSTTRTFLFRDVTELFADLGGGDDTALVNLDWRGAEVHGGAGNDTLRGGNGTQQLSGGAGDDTLLGGPGDDVLLGEAGRDSIDGGAGADFMSGGPDTDTVDYSSRTADLRVTTGDGYDDGETGESDYVAEDVEVIRGGAGNDFLAERSSETRYGSGSSYWRNALYGNGGNDTLSGGTAQDALFGGPGDDTLEAGEVPDAGWYPSYGAQFFGDYYSGGPGNDTVDYSSRIRIQDKLVISIDGVANDGQPAGPDVQAENDNVDLDVENVIGGAGNDVISGSAAANRLVGNGGNDILRGGAGDDVLDGGEGRDWMLGGAGNDTADYSSRTADLRISLNGKFDDGEVGERDNVFADVENVIGGSGNDILTGSAANNRLEGRGGNDTLTGGAGRDWLLGGEGDDTLLARDGITDFLLDGGPGNSDRAQKDPGDPAAAVELLL